MAEVTILMMKYVLLCAVLLMAAVTLSAQPDITFGKANAAITASGTRIEAVFMGNSITAGWAVVDTSFFKDHGFVGRGISGQVSSQMLLRFRSDVVALHPKVVVILAGINDIGIKMPLDYILGNLASMCEIARANGIRPVLSLLTPACCYPLYPDVDVASQVVALNVMIRDYATKHHIAFVDYYTPMVDEHRGLQKPYAYDELHPNAAGFKVMEQAVMKVLPAELNRATQMKVRVSGAKKHSWD